MNLLHISYHTSPLGTLGINDGGGLNTYVNELCNQLSIDNSVLVVTSEEVRKKTRNKYKIQTYSSVLSQENMKKKIENMDSFYSELIASHEKIGVKKFDIVHAHYWLSGIIAKKIKHQFGIPFVYTSHSLGLFNQKNTKADYRFEKEIEVMLAADIVTASSDFEINYINSYYNIPRAKIFKITPGVNEDIFYPKENFKTSEVKKIYCVGRIQEQKGQIRALDLMHLLSKLEINFHIYFVGGVSGEDGSKYLEKINNEIIDSTFTKKTTFLGSLSQESLASKLREADLLLHTSEYETFGLIAIEANACGVPVVTINNGSMKEIISNNVNGFITDDFFNEQVNDFIKHLFSNSKELISLKKKSYEKSKDYSWEKTGESIAELYKKLI